MHQPHLHTRRPGVLRRHLPARERLRLTGRKRAPLVVAMLSAVPILYLLSAVLSAQP